MPDREARGPLYFIRIEDDAREAEQNLRHFGQDAQPGLEAFLYGDAQHLSDMVSQAVAWTRANQWITLYRGIRVGLGDNGHVTFRPRDIVWSRHPQDLKVAAVTTAQPAVPERPAPSHGEPDRQDTLVPGGRWNTEPVFAADGPPESPDGPVLRKTRTLSPWLRTILYILIYAAAFVLSFVIADLLYTLLAG